MEGSVSVLTLALASLTTFIVLQLAHQQWAQNRGSGAAVTEREKVRVVLFC